MGGFKGWALALVLAALGLVALVLTLRAWGASRWGGLTQALHAQLEAARQAPQPPRYDAARELQGLPAPVQRFFRATLTDGMPLVAQAHIEHRGTFDMGANAPAWKPFTSTQRVVTRRPGFVWDARIAMAPGVAAHVHDAYVAGSGLLHASAAGVLTLADQRGTPELAQGELMRFFAEAAWYPTALLPSQGVRWEAVDDDSARATLTDGGVLTTLLFRFGPDGLVRGIRAEARGRSVRGAIVPTPWEGTWSGHVARDGMRVPLQGEVAWVTPEGRWPYWRGEVTALRYAFAAPPPR
jgi:hypothetical protein